MRNPRAIVAATCLALSVGILFAQANTGVVTGQLRNPDGKPAAGIRVSALEVPSGGAAGASALLASIAETDDAGRYRLADIPPGRYYIVAGRVESATYFPGVNGADGARIVTIAAGSVIPNVDFAMSQRSLGLRVSGRVVSDASAASIAQSRVTLQAPFGLQQAAVSADGTFEFQRVPPGFYTLRATPSPPGTAFPIVVDDRDVTGITLVITTPVNITGTARVEDAGPMPRFTLAIENGQGPISNFNINPLTDGSFRLTLPAGKFTVKVRGFPDIYRVASLTYGSVDLLNNPMEVAAGATINITFGFTKPSPWVKVSGRVIGAENLPMSRSSRSLPLQNPVLLRSLDATINADGTFEFSKVLPGIVYTTRLGPVGMEIRVGDTDVQNVEIVVPPNRQLTGRISVDAGLPLPRPNQFVLEGMPPILQSFTIGNVAPDGTFKTTLPEGLYIFSLRFDDDRYRIQSISMGATEIVDAPIQVIRIGAEPNDLSITLTETRSEWTRVNGHVTGVEFLPSNSREVVLSGTTLLRDLIAPIDADGNFVFPKVPGGSFTARLRHNPLGASAVAVGLIPGVSAVTNLNLTVSPQVPFSGRIAVPSGGSPGLFTMVLNGAPSATVLIVSPEPAVLDAMGDVLVIPVRSDGTFEGVLREGVYRVSAINAPPYRVKSAAAGTVDLLKDPLEIKLGATPAEIVVTLE